MIDNWRKAKTSVDNSTCVETGWTDDLVGYRDTKQASSSDDQPKLLFSMGAARAFLTMIKSTDRVNGNL
ncbi:DUF397 domain-containing protein [Kibdelosporangium phytohabitans]|uniref:DUF397 domain-containing protein n=1 Tax=Kibdelosporangium phytohabitans TaxID=860235 RepID=A0A0N9HXE4_9PSEU|nr:DUF397 domain-containing protein [Kibdelosporangium phytohabitans]ALG07897.1 hypothetical protein AOZ06_14105 [Kibdelosporangium phytohabitans]MBE1471169.1 hypothetical protein [Kibdelosporangium phytohabitans]